MAEDIKEKELEDKEKAEEKAKEKSWFEKVPTTFKLLGALILIIKFNQINQSGGDFKELGMWLFIVAGVLYLLGNDFLKKTTGVLLPSEARVALRKEIEDMKRSGEIPRFAKVFIDMNSGLQHNEGMPQHYLWGLEIVTKKREYKRATIIAEGNTKGIVTFQDNLGKVTGRETIPIVSMMPPWMKRMKKEDINIERFMFGGKE